MNVLVVEDMPGFARPLCEELQSTGHVATWIVSATCVQESSLIGILGSRVTQDLDTDTWSGEQERLSEIPFNTIDVAFIDGQLLEPVSSGEVFAQALNEFGIPCISITGGGAGAATMSEAGCCAGLPKEYVLLALRSGCLSIEQFVSDPGATAEQLTCFTRTTREAHLEVRRMGEKFITHFPVLDGERTCR